MERMELDRGVHGHQQSYGQLYQKLPAAHHLLIVEPDVEIAADAIDVRFGEPSLHQYVQRKDDQRRCGPREFFRPAKLSDDMSAGGVGADRKFADAVAVFVSVRVSREIRRVNPRFPNAALEYDYFRPQS